MARGRRRTGRFIQYRSPVQSQLPGLRPGRQHAEAFSWRVAASPTLAGEIAVSGYHGKYTPHFLSISEPIHSLGLDGKWRFEKFEVEGEGIYSAFDNTQTVAAAL